MIGRREFLAAGTGVVAAPFLASAQPARRTYRVGVLFDLVELGYVAGTNLVLDIRKAEGHADRLPALAAELVRLKPDLLVSPGGVGVARALKTATTTVPVIFFAVEWDPVATGIVDNLVRPGGNFTGLALLATELAAKRLELLREALPRATRVAVLWQRC